MIGFDYPVNKKRKKEVEIFLILEKGNQFYSGQYFTVKYNFPKSWNRVP